MVEVRDDRRESLFVILSDFWPSSSILQVWLKIQSEAIFSYQFHLTEQLASRQQVRQPSNLLNSILLSLFLSPILVQNEKKRTYGYFLMVRHVRIIFFF